MSTTPTYSLYRIIITINKLHAKTQSGYNEGRN